MKFNKFFKTHSFMHDGYEVHVMAILMTEGYDSELKFICWPEVENLTTAQVNMTAFGETGEIFLRKVFDKIENAGLEKIFVEKLLPEIEACLNEET